MSSERRIADIAIVRQDQPEEPRHPALRWLEKQLPIGAPGHAEFVGYSTPRNLNDRTYPLVWLALSLDPIDRKHAST